VIVRLPDGSFGNPKRLRLVAEVVRPYDGRVLDRRKDRIRFRRGYRRPIIDGRYASCPRWPRW